MKKAIFVITAMLFSATLFAQPEHGARKPPPPMPERWKRDSIRLQLYVTLMPGQINGTKNVFVTFYNELDGFAEKNKPEPPKNEIEKIVKKRAQDLKAILNQTQFDRFEAFEKEFMPPPPPQSHRPPPDRTNNNNL